MLKNDRNGIKNELRLFSNLKVLVMAAFFVALSIVCGKLLAFNVGPFIRFSLENFPVFMSSFCFGPLIGGLTALVADIVGCLIVGYQINPLVTIGAFSIGFLSGAVYKLFKGAPLFIRLWLSISVAHLVGSVCIKTVGLSTFYSQVLIVVAFWRLINYLIIGVIEIFLLYYLMKSKSITYQIERIRYKH